MKSNYIMTLTFDNQNEVKQLKSILAKITPINQDIKTLLRGRLKRNKIEFTPREKNVLRTLQQKINNFSS